MTFTKTIHDTLLDQKITTTIYNDLDILRASRCINGKLLTITTKAPTTTIEYTKRAMNMVNLSNDDFDLLQDCKEDEIDELEAYN